MTTKVQPETAANTAHNQPEDSTANAALNDEHWDTDGSEAADYEERWLALASREKERSRIQRQMKARRELERRHEEKRLRELVDDWTF